MSIKSSCSPAAARESWKEEEVEESESDQTLSTSTTSHCHTDRDMSEEQVALNGTACDPVVFTSRPRPRKRSDPVKLVKKGPRVFPCSLCDREFSSKQHLENHTRTHTGERPFKCSECDLWFAQAVNRDRHFKQLHSDARQHLCTHADCDQRFYTLLKWRRHVASHSDEPPTKAGHKQLARKHKCDVCDKAFCKPVQLRRHRETHEGGRLKVHQCDVCKKMFAEHCKMQRHKLTHMEKTQRPRPFLCKSCDRAFFTNNALKVHTDKIHNTMKSRAEDKPTTLQSELPADEEWGWLEERDLMSLP